MSHISEDPEERIDNAQRTFDIENDGVAAEDRESGTAGLPYQENVPAETIESIEQDRAERLAGEDRPENTEIDNTGRTFDPGAGKFTDNPAYDESRRPYAVDEEA